VPVWTVAVSAYGPEWPGEVSSRSTITGCSPISGPRAVKPVSLSTPDGWSRVLTEDEASNVFKLLGGMHAVLSRAHLEV
jgi:hypothetical protein